VGGDIAGTQASMIRWPFLNSVVLPDLLFGSYAHTLAGYAGPPRSNVSDKYTNVKRGDGPQPPGGCGAVRRGPRPGARAMQDGPASPRGPWSREGGLNMCLDLDRSMCQNIRDYVGSAGPLLKYTTSRQKTDFLTKNCVKKTITLNNSDYGPSPLSLGGVEWQFAPPPKHRGAISSRMGGAGGLSSAQPLPAARRPNNWGRKKFPRHFLKVSFDPSKGSRGNPPLPPSGGGPTCKKCLLGRCGVGLGERMFLAMGNQRKKTFNSSDLVL